MNCFRPRGTIPYRPTGVTNANGMPDMKHTQKLLHVRMARVFGNDIKSY